MSVSLKIKIFDNSGTRILQVAKSTVTIGSASHCDVVFNEQSVNPEHTRAWVEGGRIWVQDLGTTSGTALNDIRLPALKPMLVRDLDVLRLGESGSTIGLEVIAVRAPVVKPKAAEAPVNPNAAAAAAGPENKAPSSVELEKRKEEADRLAREIAGLRLQLQMSQLEKSAADEMSQQLQDLRAETERVQEQKAKWDENFRKLEGEKRNLRKEIDKELLEFKANALKDLKKVVSGEAEVQAQVLNAQITKLSEENSGLEAKLREAVEEKQSLLNRMETAEDTQSRAVNSEIKILHEQKAKLSETLRKAEGEREALRAELAEASHAGQDAKKLNDQKVKLAESLRKVESERDQLRNQLKQSESAHVQILRKAEEYGRSLAEKLQLAEEEKKTLYSRMEESESTHAFEINGEIKKLNEQKAMLAESLRKAETDLRKAESEREAMRAQIRDAESDTNEHLRKLEREREALRTKMEQSQVNIGYEHNAELKKLAEQKTKLSDSLKDLKSEYEFKLQAETKKLAEMKAKMSDSVRQAESERDQLRKALDKEKQEHAAHTTKLSARHKAAAAMEEDLAREIRRAKRHQARAVSNTWRTVGVTSIIVAVILASVWYGSGYLKKIGSRTLSSTAPSAPVASAPIPPPTKTAKAKRFEPKKGKKYRGSYTENVLFLENYVAAEENGDFRRKWLIELSREATNAWKVDAWSLSPVGVEELAMIRELDRMKVAINPDHEQEGLEKMREREAKFLRELEAVFKTRAGVDRFLKFKRSFYQRNQQYLVRE